jgi:hypothetical protein
MALGLLGWPWTDGGRTFPTYPVHAVDTTDLAALEMSGGRDERSGGRAGDYGDYRRP